MSRKENFPASLFREYHLRTAREYNAQTTGEGALFESDFLTSSEQSQVAYRKAIAEAIDCICQSLPDSPYSGKSPQDLRALLEGAILPEAAGSSKSILESIGQVITNSVIVTHPRTLAHLHCPPLIAAQAAEVVITALNQSMDSFDQAPAASVLEEKVVNWLCREVGLGPTAGGIFTSGGTQSNYMALLLARDACIQKNWNWSVQSRGLPTEARRLRILCSDVAHFTVEKSAAQLGLGTEAVIRVETDKAFRMHPEQLKAALAKLRDQNLIPMAIVGTAGITDFGSIDPLQEIEVLAHATGAWFHIDAAYGSALLFSQRYRDRIKGVELADSVSMDFHKLFWQPIPCAAFLLKDSRRFQFIEMKADYLNPQFHEELGIPNLVTQSLATTRRFDALKLWFSFQSLGRKKLASMIDRTIELTASAAGFISQQESLELFHQPTLTTVVIRYHPPNTNLDLNSLNRRLRQRLFEKGIAVIGHTVVRGMQCLKFTCMNPAVSNAQIEELVEEIVSEGRRMESDERSIS